MNKSYSFDFLQELFDSQGVKNIERFYTDSRENRSPFRIIADTIKGLGASEYENQILINPQLAGGRVSKSHVLPRYIEFQLDFKDDYRDYIIRFFKVNVIGRLTVSRVDVKRWIDYRIDMLEIDQATVNHSVTATIRLVCEQPFFSDMDDFGKNLAETQPMIFFPYWISKKEGNMAGYKKFSTETMLVNKGDVETDLRVTFYAIGDVKNPKLTLRTGEYLRVIVDLVRGDKLEVVPGTPIILLNGINIIHRMDRMSTFITLNVGQNFLTYSAELGQDNINVYLNYTPLYNGI